MDAIGIRIEFQQGKFADHLKAAKACQLMMWQAAWSADYPDGENFMQLLYGPNTGQSNNGCYESKAFDAFYEKMLALPDSPERNRLFLEMTRQMEVDGAWGLHVSRERNQLIWPWVKGYKKHPILNAEFVYMDIERGTGTNRRRWRRDDADASCRAGSPRCVAALALSGAGDRRAGSGEGDPRRVPGRARPASIRRPCTICIRAPSCRRSSRRCSPTTTSRGPRRSSR